MVLYEQKCSISFLVFAEKKTFFMQKGFPLLLFYGGNVLVFLKTKKNVCVAETQTIS